MGERRIYLFPNDVSEPAAFCQRSIAVLTQMGLVAPSSQPVVNLSQFHPGDRAHAILPGRVVTLHPTGETMLLSPSSTWAFALDPTQT